MIQSNTWSNTTTIKYIFLMVMFLFLLKDGDSRLTESSVGRGTWLYRAAHNQLTHFKQAYSIFNIIYTVYNIHCMYLIYIYTVYVNKDGMKSNLYRSEENVWKCLHNSSDVRHELLHLCVPEFPYKINKLTFVYLEKVSSFRTSFHFKMKWP